MSHPLRTIAPPPCLPLYIKDLKEDTVDWLAAGCLRDVAAAGSAGGSCCCACASLRTETLGIILEIRGNMGQCKSED
jgi:hypothetical protein